MESDDKTGALFGALDFCDPHFANVSNSVLAQLAGQDRGAKEELYSRISPAMERTCGYYCRHYPFIDESEAFYGLFLTTERVLASYRPVKGPFLFFWSSCARRFMVSLRARSYASFAKKQANEMPFIPEIDGLANPERPYGDSGLLLTEIAGNCTARELCAYILYLAGYTAAETAGMLSVGLVFVRSSVKKVNREMKKAKVERV